MIPTIERILLAANAKGYDGSPMLLSVDSETGNRIAVIVSATEPVYLTAPLDVVWYNTDSSEILIRESRSASSPYVNTWAEVTEESFWSEQFWDVDKPSDWNIDLLEGNIGNTHKLLIGEINGVDKSGDKMDGSLLPRDLTEEDNGSYADTEVAPVGWINSKLVVPVKNLAGSVYSQLSSVRNSVTAVRNRVSKNEVDIETLQRSTPIVFDQVTPLLEWSFVATNDTPAIYTVLGEDGGYIIPVSQGIVESEPDGEGLTTKNYVIKFAEPRAGKLIIVHS